MSKTPTGLHLRRIDPSCNMARFYALSIQPTLFGGLSLIRDWGRIGTKGRTKVEIFDEPGAANIALSQLEHTKRRRGYR